MSENTITVTQVKSGLHAKPKTRGTLRALGLGRIGKRNTLPDRPEIRGMIARVPHLVEVEANASATAGKGGRVASVRGEDPVRPDAVPAASGAEGDTEANDAS
jgi:large subunit ribosomal protein L30